MEFVLFFLALAFIFHQSDKLSKLEKRVALLEAANDGPGTEPAR